MPDNWVALIKPARVRANAFDELSPEAQPEWNYSGICIYCEHIRKMPVCNYFYTAGVRGQVRARLKLVTTNGHDRPMNLLALVLMLFLILGAIVAVRSRPSARRVIFCRRRSPKQGPNFRRRSTRGSLPLRDRHIHLGTHGFRRRPPQIFAFTAVLFIGGGLRDASGRDPWFAFPDRRVRRVFLCHGCATLMRRTKYRAGS